MSDLVVNVSQMSAQVTTASVSTLSNGALVRLSDAGLPWSVAWGIVKRASRAGQLPTTEFVARLKEIVAADYPEIDQSWAAELVRPDPVRLDGVFNRLSGLNEDVDRR